VISLIQVLRYSAPIAFGGIGESIAQKAGIINIGLEGTMLSGAYAATTVSLMTKNPWLGLFAGAVVGVCVALITALFTIKLEQDQIVVGTAINLLSLGICGTLFERRSATGTLLNLPAIPKLFLGTDFVLVFLILAAAVFSILLYRTDWGLKLRAAGEYPPALEAAGFSPALYRLLALMIAGGFGGIGGAYIALGIAQSFATDMIAGRGFVAIALVTFARWKPHWMVVVAVLIGTFETLQYELQLSKVAIPKSLLMMLPYLATLIILIVVGKGAKSPQSLGKPIKP
jgi:general nucleoside transport system permease protein